LLLSASAASAGTTGRTPGTYTNYAFDNAGSGFEAVDFAITVDQDPGYPAATYWANQFDLVGAPRAYAGMQSNGGDKRVFLFSAWDATEAKIGSAGSYCLRFDGEGVGYSCRKQHEWKQGHTYRFRVTIRPDKWLTVVVDDLTEKTSFTLGSIKTGATRISASNMVNWTEYFEWNDKRATCTGQPYSRAAFALPKGRADGRQHQAAIRSTQLSNTCQPFAAVRTVASGSVHENGIGNSLRGALKAGSFCLDVRERLQEDAELALYQCHGGPNQSFVQTQHGAIEAQSNYCLSHSGPKAIMRTCDRPGARTRWQFNAGEVRKAGTSLCLTHSVDQLAVALRTCNGAAAQRWDVSSLGR